MKLLTSKEMLSFQGRIIFVVCATVEYQNLWLSLSASSIFKS